MATLAAVSPPGWESFVKEHKNHPKVDNPFALAWYLHDKGAKPGDVKSDAGPGECKGCFHHAAAFEIDGQRRKYLDQYSLTQPPQESETPEIIGRDYSTEERRNLAKKGHALADGSFPIANAKDLENAIKRAHSGNHPGAARRLIVRRAKELGVTLPDDFKAELEASHDLDRHCQDCGKLVPDDAVHCQNCGVKLSAAAGAGTCPHCQSDMTGLVPPDFETGKCEACSKTFNARESMGDNWPSPDDVSGAAIEIFAARIGIADDRGLEPGEIHPNGRPFKMILHQTDQASTRAPHGAEGHGHMNAERCANCPHRVLIPSRVADRRMGTLVGMGLNVSGLGLEGHDSTKKVGAITHAGRGIDPDPENPVRLGPIAPNDVVVAGLLHEKDSPRHVAALRQSAAKGELGGSFEITGAKVRDRSAPIWTLDDFKYTGAAALAKSAAAYHGSQMAAAGARTKEDEMALEDDVRALAADVRTLKAKQADMEAAASLKAKSDEEEAEAARVQAKKDEEAEEAAAVKAKKDEEEAEASRVAAAKDAKTKEDEAETMDEEARAKRVAAAKHDPGEPDADDAKATALRAESETLRAKAADKRLEASQLRAAAAGMTPAMINAAADLVTKAIDAKSAPLATAVLAKVSQMATDGMRGTNGGRLSSAPTRDSMSGAAITSLLSKYPALKSDKALSEADVDEILAKAAAGDAPHLKDNPLARMEIKKQLMLAGRMQ